MEEYREIVSFQRITLSFLFVSGALFTYLIPPGPTYVCYDRHAGQQRSITGGVCHARTCIHKNDTTLCKSHGQKPEGQHEYSKEQDGVIEINLSYTSHNRL